MKINPIQIKTSNSEIGWMLGSPKNIFDKVYRYFLFVCWTVISPLVILAILIYYIIDVSVSYLLIIGYYIRPDLGISNNISAKSTNV